MSRHRQNCGAKKAWAHAISRHLSVWETFKTLVKENTSDTVSSHIEEIVKAENTKLTGIG